MKTHFAAGLPLVFYCLLPTSTLALTAQELCERVYQQYGVRAEECDAAEDRSQQLTEGLLDDEIRESAVFFPKGGSQLDDDARLQISVLIQVLETPLMTGACLRLVGHSDTSGSATRNLQISQERAAVVAKALRSGLRDRSRIKEVLAEGETRPLSGFSGASSQNRRVEILARDCP